MQHRHRYLVPLCAHGSARVAAAVEGGPAVSASTFNIRAVEIAVRTPRTVCAVVATVRAITA